MTAVDLEVAIQDAAGARHAFTAGADRVELCQALSGTGGLTPSAATIDSVLCAAPDPAQVAVLIRPRPGGFVYSADEVAVVTADIRDAVQRGAGGIVVGALTAHGDVDLAALERWKDAAGPAELVFHRAIDTLVDPVSAVDRLAACGVNRVLTSGGAARSIDGADVLARLVAEARGRIAIMCGGGVRLPDIPALVATGVEAIHLSARRRTGGDAPTGPGGGDAGHDVTDAEIVASAVQALRAATA